MPHDPVLWAVAIGILASSWQFPFVFHAELSLLGLEWLSAMAFGVEQWRPPAPLCFEGPARFVTAEAVAEPFDVVTKTAERVGCFVAILEIVGSLTYRTSNPLKNCVALASRWSTS